MEVKWKVDLSNPGACKSLAKELASTYPNFMLFLKENLISDESSIDPSCIYDFFIPLISSLQADLFMMESELRNSQGEVYQYKNKLETLQQQNIQSSQNPRSQPKFRKPPSLYSNEHDIVLNHLKIWREAATIIQKYWRGYKCRKNFSKRLENIIVQARPAGPRSITNQEVMETVLKEIDKRKLTLEQFYRAADKDGNGKVSFEELKSFMEDLQILLPRSTLTRFMRIIDEDCSGIVDKSEFFHALAAYNVSTESLKSSRTYEEDMLLKFVKIMESREIEPENLFSLCDVDSSGSMSLKELESYLIKLKVGFQVKEVHALMRRLDSNSDGELSLEEFRKHFQKGQSFFKQEVVASTHTMALPTKQQASDKSTRDLFKTLEFTGSFMALLSQVSAMPDSECPVSSFYVALEKCFNCKLNRSQIDLVQKVLVLNNKGNVSYETLKPVIVFYSTRSLENRENYVLRFKMHLPKVKPEEKIFTRKEMVDELFFSPEQVMDAIQFLAEPGEEYVTSDMFYIDKNPEEREKPNKEEILNYFNEKIRESGLDIRNIFRFADKNNEGQVSLDQLKAGFLKLVKGITPENFEDFESSIGDQVFNLQRLIAIFPVKRLDKNGLTIEAVFWLRYLGRTFRDAKMTSVEFFNKLEKNSEGLASHREIKVKIRESFEAFIKPKRVDLISEHVFPQDTSMTNSTGFSQLFLACQNTDHPASEIKEYEKIVLSMNFDQNIPLPPPGRNPSQPPQSPPVVSKVIIKTQPFISIELSYSLKKISQRVLEGKWCGDLFKEKGFALNLVISKEEDLFMITKIFEITRNENQKIYEEVKNLNNGRETINVFFLSTLVDVVTHSLNKLPVSWNREIDANMGKIIEQYIRNRNIRGMDLSEVQKDLHKRVDYALFSDFDANSEKVASFFHENSPAYHFLSVLNSYIDEKYFSIFNLIKSKLIFDSQYLEKLIDLKKVYLTEQELKSEWDEVKLFNKNQADQVLKFLYPNFKSNFPAYTFQYLIDVVKKNYLKNEMTFEPFNTNETDQGHKTYFKELTVRLRYPLSYYFGEIKIDEMINIQTVKTTIRSLYDSPEVFRLEFIDKQFVLSYHLMAVLDSYRSEPSNFVFDIKKIYQIFNDDRRRKRLGAEFSNISKEKCFNQQDLENFKKKYIRLSENPPEKEEEQKKQEEAKKNERLDKIEEEKVRAEIRKKEIIECEDFDYFFDSMKKNKLVYAFQIIFLIDISQDLNFFMSIPFKLNKDASMDLFQIFSSLANLLKSNNVATLQISNIHLDKEITVSDLASIKLFDGYKTELQPIIRLNGGKLKFYQFLSIIESFLETSYSVIDVSSFPDNFIRLINPNKKLLEIFKNPPLNQIYSFKNFQDLFSSSFNGINIEIIERLFKKFDRRSFNQVFMYEILTAIDLMIYQSLRKSKINFLYSDEFQVTVENTGAVNEIYSQKREAHRKYLQLADFFDESTIPTLRRKTLYDMRNVVNSQTFTGFENISLIDLNNYITRITNKRLDMTYVYNDLKIDDQVKFYHFFAVFESYRKRVYCDKYEFNVNPNNALNIAPIERNPDLIRLPADTKVLKPGSYEHDLYKVKIAVKVDYKNIYEKFKNSTVNGNFTYDEFKRLVKELIEPRISDVNLNELVRNVDKDRNKEISLEEFFSYVFEVPIEEQKVKVEVKFDGDKPLSPKDFFDPVKRNLTTILNSQEAAIIRCKELLKSNTRNGLFDDPDFGPHLGNNGDVCLYWNSEPPSSSYPNPHTKEFQWKSAKDVYANPDFIKAGTESGDVIQGSLGDCWLIGALSVMALRDDLLYGNLEDINTPEEITLNNAKYMSKGVYSGIFHNLKDVGMYVFKFFINSAWRWVIVDDKIPMYVDLETKNCEYVFGHCKDKEELWVSLLEKAYAKIFGCYEALNGGLIDDALTDLTGKVAEKCKISGSGGAIDLNLIDPQKTDELWVKLQKYREDRTLMGCSIEGDGVEGDVVVDGERTGLLSRHAYSIIDILTLEDPQAPKGRHRLLRIRNPWGQREWQGKWRDHSEELERFSIKINEISAKLGEEEKFKEIDPNDGTFFMCFKDWRRIFHNLYACVDFSDNWFGKRFAGQWTVENSGGVPLQGKPDECARWAKNPQYCIELKDTTEVFISLSQRDGRYQPNSKFPFEETINTACFTIMRTDQSELVMNRFDQGKIVKLSVLKAHRNIEMRIKLDAGRYVIVPATMNFGKIGEFWLSIYFDCIKSKVSAYNCRNTSEVGELIAEEEEIEENFTEKELDEIRRKFVSLRY